MLIDDNSRKLTLKKNAAARRQNSRKNARNISNNRGERQHLRAEVVALP
jgi:hypothetical protein